ncbi:portal protein (head-tail preconnector protein) from prophage [Escherichia coli]|nr:portal protein (head-tail preconnector protein) from prophage [Escherichia coli]
MAFLDDVIGVFSPGWKAARLRSRAVIQAYEAVKTTRTHKARRENRTADQLSQYGPCRYVSRPVTLITTTIWSLVYLTSWKNGWWGKTGLLSSHIRYYAMGHCP